MHSRLVRSAVALLTVARRAGGNDVLPDRFAAPTARDHVVHREAVRLAPAVLAGPCVAGEHCLASDLAAMAVAWDPDVAHEADHAGPIEGEALGVKRPLTALDDLRAGLQHEDGRPPHVADIDRLVARIQDEHPAPDPAARLVAVRSASVPVHRRPPQPLLNPPKLQGTYALKPYVRVRCGVHSARILDGAPPLPSGQRRTTRWLGSGAGNAVSGDRVAPQDPDRLRLAPQRLDRGRDG